MAKRTPRKSNLVIRTEAVTSNLKRLLGESQALLADFLCVEIEIGFTLLRISKSAKPDVRDRRLAEVGRALETINRLLDRISDSHIRDSIRDEASKLESRLKEGAHRTNAS